jgi:hypothetical protein
MGLLILYLTSPETHLRRLTRQHNTHASCLNEHGFCSWVSLTPCTAMMQEKGMQPLDGLENYSLFMANHLQTWRAFG